MSVELRGLLIGASDLLYLLLAASGWITVTDNLKLKQLRIDSFVIIHFEIIEDTAKVQRSSSGEEGTLICPSFGTLPVAATHTAI